MRHHLFNAREALTSAYAEAAESGAVPSRPPVQAVK